MRESIKVEHAALDETPGGDIILRGVISPESLDHIRTDDYQREVLPLSSLDSLIKALKANKPVPDICLGMRGGDYREVSGTFYLQGDTYVIDGLQRLSAARYLMQSGEHAGPRLGTTCHFNTTSESERDMFKILNTAGLKLSPNVLIRNARSSNIGVQLLWELSEDASCPIFERVQWEQRMRKTELVSALTLLKTANNLHANFGPVGSDRWESGIATLSTLIADTIGRKIVYGNLKRFWEVVDHCWGVRNVTYKEPAVHLRGGFLFALARCFTAHTDFWDKDRRFNIDRALLAKLKLFPTRDPSVRIMASANSKSSRLCDLMTEHINSGKRTRRLTPFRVPKGKEAA